MQCKCYGRINGLVQVNLAAQMPEGSEGLAFDLPQLRISLTDGVLPVFDIKGSYQAPKKAGGFKRVKVDTFIAATFCPFCGVKCRAPSEEEKAAAEADKKTVEEQELEEFKKWEATGNPVAGVNGNLAAKAGWMARAVRAFVKNQG